MVNNFTKYWKFRLCLGTGTKVWQDYIYIGLGQEQKFGRVYIYIGLGQEQKCGRVYIYIVDILVNIIPQYKQPTVYK
jgi:hypothetical protein